MKRNKKGLLSGIFVFVVFIFLFAFTSIIAYVAWSDTNSAVQSLPNETVRQPVKDKIDEKLTPFFTWGDYLFVYMFVAMLISYLITASSIPARNPFFFLIFMGLLIIVTIVAMIFSNAWEYLIQNPDFVSAALAFPFTDFFMRYYPIFVFFIGVTGALIFYGRYLKEKSSEVGSVDF